VQVFGSQTQARPVQLSPKPQVEQGPPLLLLVLSVAPLDPVEVDAPPVEVPGPVDPVAVGVPVDPALPASAPEAEAVVAEWLPELVPPLVPGPSGMMHCPVTEQT
jgi:hypothetical protein